MLLKRLELQGFKSFADKTILDFDGGVTAVVGPNGSGKSNISDAVRWVMGEMSAKSLRGANMQDVIFSGTETRKAVNYAEVSMVLDNSEHIFPVDFEEVIVTRRVFRSGESVYQINRANCRLKDIHEMFMDTGLGRDGYSMIGQGNVSQILSTKAEDRRSLFEEAAGVSKYKYRKEEASRKLLGVEENLVRINDIATELESQLAPLERQSEKARKYLVVYDEMRKLDVNLSLRGLEKNRNQFDEADSLYKSVEEELNELKKKESKTEEEINILYSQSRQKDEEQNIKNKELMENETKSMACVNEISMAENDIKNNCEMMQRIDREIEAAIERNDERTTQIETIKKEIEEKESQAKMLLRKLNLMHESDVDISEKQAVLHDEIEDSKRKIIEKMNEISVEKAELTGLETSRKNFIERRDILEKEIYGFKQGIEETKEEISRNQREAENKREKLEKMRKSLLMSKERADLVKADIEKNGLELNRINVDYNSKSSKRRILEDMENDYEGYARSVKAVLKANELKHLSIYGTVANLLEVEKKYVTAIETAIGGSLQNIIVQDESDAKEAIAYLRNSRAGRATFLPVSSVKGRIIENVESVKKANGYIGLASELVKYNIKYDGIFKNLLGRVVVVDNIDNAITLSRKFGYKFRVVTLLGDVLNAGGSMSGGSTGKTGGFLSRAAEIKDLTNELETLKIEILKRKEAQSKYQAQLQNLQGQINSYTPIVREYENDLIKMESDLEHLRQSLDVSGDSHNSYTIELEEIERQLLSSSDHIAKLLAEIRKNEGEKQLFEESAARLEEEHEAVSLHRDEQAKELMEHTMELAGLQRDIQSMNANIESLRSEIEFMQQTNKSKKEDKQRIYKVNDDLYKRINEKNKFIEELKILSDAIRKQLQSIDEQKADIVERLKKIQSANKDLTDRLLNLQQEMSRLDNRRVKLDIERENTINRLWDDYELTVTAAEEIRTELENERDSSKRLSELKSQIRALGNVNMDSIEEYKNVKERFEFLTTQKKDLEVSKENLNKVIESMDELMEEHFSQQFDIINKSFEKVFKELFGGGHGRLYLSEPDNVLESGIEIEVQLPGKGLQSINLYSGGEKSFIAIALLFAILNVKPTPFCILDEIDAALDDVNVSRFATYLRNYLDDTQFIVITHRRGTMEAANILYGVTMQEKGVSKLLSLHIDDVDEDMAG